MAMRLTLAFQGNLRAHAAAENRAVSKGIRAATDKRSRALQLAYRREVNQRFPSTRRPGGGNRRAANAIRRETYFKDGPFRSSALIYSKFGRKENGKFLDYLAPYVFGATLRPRRGKFMPVPNGRGRGARNRLDRALSQLGQPRSRIRVIETRTPGVFVVVRQTRRRSSLPLGWLIRRITIRPRINIDRVTRAERAKYAAALVEETDRAAARERLAA